jgi:hypothetical protein
VITGIIVLPITPHWREVVAAYPVLVADLEPQSVNVGRRTLTNILHPGPNCV